MCIPTGQDFHVTTPRTRTPADTQRERFPLLTINLKVTNAITLLATIITVLTMVTTRGYEIQKENTLNLVLLTRYKKESEKKNNVNKAIANLRPKLFVLAFKARSYSC